MVALHRGIFHSLGQLQLQERGRGGEERGGRGERGEEGRRERGGRGERGEGGEGRGVEWRVKCNTTQRDGVE